MAHQNHTPVSFRAHEFEAYVYAVEQEFDQNGKTLDLDEDHNGYRQGRQDLNGPRICMDSHFYTTRMSERFAQEQTSHVFGGTQKIQFEKLVKFCEKSKLGLKEFALSGWIYQKSLVHDCCDDHDGLCSFKRPKPFWRHDPMFYENLRVRRELEKERKKALEEKQKRALEKRKKELEDYPRLPVAISGRTNDRATIPWASFPWMTRVIYPWTQCVTPSPWPKSVTPPLTKSVTIPKNELPEAYERFCNGLKSNAEDMAFSVLNVKDDEGMI